MLKAGIEGLVHVICKAEAAAAAAAHAQDPTSVENSAYNVQVIGTQDNDTVRAVVMAGGAQPH